METGQCDPNFIFLDCFKLLTDIHNPSVVCNVFERLVSVREGSGVLPTYEFVFRKALGTCDELLCVQQMMNYCVSNTLYSALESGQEARIVQIHFKLAFDKNQASRNSLQALL